MSRKAIRDKIQRKERYRGFVRVLRSAKEILKDEEDSFLINQINALIDRTYNQDDLRYKPETLVFRAIKKGYCTKATIEAFTLVSGDLLENTLDKLTLSQKIKYEDGLYVECFE